MADAAGISRPARAELAAMSPGVAPRAGIGSSRIARDISILTAGTVLGAACNVVQVFLIPRLVSVADFGYWRLFLLYAGYAGLLHLGLADGALLRWAGRPLSDFRDEVRRCLKFLLVEHLLVMLPAAAAIGYFFHGRPELRLACLAAVGFAVIVNSATVLQFALQAGRRFVPVALAGAAPVALFVAGVAAFSRRSAVTLAWLIAAYMVAWSAAAVFLWWSVKPAPATGPAAPLGWRYVALGWPIVLANTGFGIVQSADRLVLSSAAGIEDFAQYSLAASTMFVPVTVILAAARAFFPHLAAQPREEHGATYRQANRLITLAWAVLLPYGIAVEFFVRRVLPAYVPGLPVVRVLLLGVLFFASIQILQMSVFNLHGRQREFLACIVVFVAVGFALSYLALTRIGSLAAVATAQVGTAAACWMTNAWTLRSVTREGASEWARMLGVFAFAALSLWAAASLLASPWMQAAAYYALIALPVWAIFGADLRRLHGHFRGRGPAAELLESRPMAGVGD